MDYSKYIDHTFLKAEATKFDIDKIISEAKQYGFKTICVNSSWVSYAKKQLAGTVVGITSVIGFPLGAMSTKAKAFEAKNAIKDGADEIDMVINVGKLKDNDKNYVLDDIKAVKKAIKKKTLKVIVETALLTEEELIRVCQIVLESGAEFIKTSTGFSTRGATFQDVKIMKEMVGDKIQIKAAGGVKTFEDMQKMIEYGATRIGTSSGVKLLEGQKIDGERY